MTPVIYSIQVADQGFNVPYLAMVRADTVRVGSRTLSPSGRCNALSLNNDNQGWLLTALGLQIAGIIPLSVRRHLCGYVAKLQAAQALLCIERLYLLEAIPHAPIRIVSKLSHAASQAAANFPSASSEQ
jgi:hypothetical protein